MPLVPVKDYRHPEGWLLSQDPEARSREYCTLLEAGYILYFAEPPFLLQREDREFLISQRQSASPLTRNLSYRPLEDRLRGVATRDSKERERLHRVMRRYSKEVTQFVSRFLTPYAARLSLDYTSFRPFQEAGRRLPLHKRNDLLHVDAFPGRPTRGGRILRVFTNVHPEEARVWLVTGPFEALASRYAGKATLPHLAARAASPAGRALRRLARALRLRTAERTPYDLCMLRFHDYLKEDRHFQQSYPKERVEFPPGSTWLVFTDGVAHAVLSGQYALEQTFIIPPAGWVAPEKSPLRLLEAALGCSLAPDPVG